MTTYVYVRSVDKKKSSAADWEKTDCKKLAKWVAETGAAETPIARRPGLTTHCFKLQDDRLVMAEERDEETVRVQNAIEQGINAVCDFITDEKNQAPWKARALLDALRSQGIEVD